MGKEFGSNVIVWGTGYGGALATFARKKYPHLITAVILFSKSVKVITRLERAKIFEVTELAALK